MTGTKVILTCGPFDLDNATAQSGQCIVGATPPTTTVGFVHALSLAARDRGLPAIHIDRGGIVVHEANFLDGHAKFPPSDAAMQRKTSGSAPGPEVIDEILIRAVVTFVLEVRHDGDEDDAPADVESFRRMLPDLMMTRRYAGGTLHPRRARSDLVSPQLSPRDVARRLREIPGGFMLRDRHDHLRAELGKGRDHLDVLLETVAFRPREGGGSARVLPGALVPISVGFRALEPPARRRTGRNPAGDRLHVYADGLSSVGQWAHTRRLAKAETPLEGCLWAPFVDEGLGLYYASATAAGVTADSLPSKRI